MILFGAVSMYGTFRGIPVEGVIINFRDVGPMIAGLLGGPVIGGVAGLLGGLHRFAQGGDTALPCFVATVVAGVIAGYAIYRWKGRITMLRMTLLAIAVECLHLLVIFPLLSIPTGVMTSGAVLNIISITLLPMCMVNIAGLLIFAYIMRRCELLFVPDEKFSLEKLKREFRQLITPPEEKTDEEEEEKYVR
ncbi:MAG TPA: hypothetical protein O0X38_06565 [Methanocorpusculum sp.]|nr:hypothetical protein [Methanocorpusculum sp.]